MGMSTAILKTPPAQLVFDSVRDAIAGSVTDIDDLRRVHAHVAQRKDLFPAIEQGLSKGIEGILRPHNPSGHAIYEYNELE
jgi:hypothetical protein